MLRVTIRAGELTERSVYNVVATLDIAYRAKRPLADYLVALTLARGGEQQPAELANYPRWAASLWDLVARALTAVLYRADQAPATAKPDRRCAYATKLNAVIERANADSRGTLLGSVDIAQRGSQRGTYTANFTEDIQGKRSVQFDYGCKALNPADLVLRAICWAYFGKDVLAPCPALILPPTMRIEGEDRFHLAALAEPALTGFKRHRAQKAPSEGPVPLARAVDYVAFLQDC